MFSDRRRMVQHQCTSPLCDTQVETCASSKLRPHTKYPVRGTYSNHYAACL